MPTESFDKEFVLDSKRAVESFIKIISRKPEPLIIPPEIRKMTSPEACKKGEKIILEFLANCVLKENVCNYDKKQRVFTCFNKALPQIYGEGQTEHEAKDKMVDETIEFLTDYKSNLDICNSAFIEVQRIALEKLLLSINDKAALAKLLGIT